MDCSLRKRQCCWVTHFMNVERNLAFILSWNKIACELYNKARLGLFNIRKLISPRRFQVLRSLQTTTIAHVPLGVWMLKMLLPQWDLALHKATPACCQIAFLLRIPWPDREVEKWSARVERANRRVGSRPELHKIWSISFLTSTFCRVGHNLESK